MRAQYAPGGQYAPPKLNADDALMVGWQGGLGDCHSLVASEIAGLRSGIEHRALGLWQWPGASRKQNC